MSPLEKFSRWLKLKFYQLEVTYSVYIFTPIEKFVFYSVLFLLVSLTLIAMTLYLPKHVAFILGRAWFYMHGDSVDIAELTKEAVQTLAAGGGSASSTTVATQTTALVKEL